MADLYSAIEKAYEAVDSKPVDYLAFDNSKLYVIAGFDEKSQAPRQLKVSMAEEGRPFSEAFLEDVIDYVGDCNYMSVEGKEGELVKYRMQMFEDSFCLKTRFVTYPDIEGNEIKFRPRNEGEYVFSDLSDLEDIFGYEPGGTSEVFGKINPLDAADAYSWSVNECLSTKMVFRNKGFRHAEINSVFYNGLQVNSIVLEQNGANMGRPEVNEIGALVADYMGGFSVSRYGYYGEKLVPKFRDALRHPNKKLGLLLWASGAKVVQNKLCGIEF